MLFLILFPALAQATPLGPKVEWSHHPLWSLSKFYPGDSSQATVIVFNNDISTHRIYLEFDDIKDGGLMGGVELSMEGKLLSIIETNDLGEIKGGASFKIPIALKFKDKSGNQYKGKSLSSLACIRFELGAKVCTPNNIVADAQGTSGSAESPVAGSSHDSSSRTGGRSVVASSLSNVIIDSSAGVPLPGNLLVDNSRLQETEAPQYQDVQGASKKKLEVEDSRVKKFDVPNSEELGATEESGIAMRVVAATSIIVILLGRLIIA